MDRQRAIRTALVVGASGGIGGALVRELVARPAVSRVHAWSRSPLLWSHDKVREATVDIVDEASIERAAADLGDVDLAIVATGMLITDDGRRPEKSLRDLDAGHLAQAFLTNAIGPALVAKHVVPRLAQGAEGAVFAALSARVGSIGDNRIGGWYGYRASKAALNQLVRTLAIEMARSGPGPIAVALHPGTVDTALSKPFQGGVPARQLQSADAAASRLLAVVDGLQSNDNGAFVAWDGSRIEY